MIMNYWWRPYRSLHVPPKLGVQHVCEVESALLRLDRLLPDEADAVGDDLERRGRREDLLLHAVGEVSDFLVEPGQEGGRLGRKTVECLTELLRRVHHVAEEGDCQAMHVGNGCALQLDVPIIRSNFLGACT